MGTSKSFSETGHSIIPNWGNLSTAMTTSCNSTTVPIHKLTTILKRYIVAIGGSRKAGQGNSKIGGRSGLKTAKNLGAFFGAFTSSGNNLREALKSTGLTDFENKSVADVINHLIEFCSGVASTIDENAAKEASRLLLEELVDSAEDIDEVEELLSKTFEENTSEDLIIKYFGYYVYEHLSKWFYEHLIKKKNESDCNNLFRQIKEFIFERLKEVQRSNPLQNVNWGSNEADNLMKNIQQDVLYVFE